MTDLPPFDPKPTCPKCGGTRIRVFWQQAITDPLGGRDLPECMIRTCKRCYYDWRELPLDAMDTRVPTDDDEPEDAYLAAKLAAQCPQSEQKPASTARNRETGISYPLDQHDAAESNLERSPTCADKSLPEIGADEPSIPVSRIVAVLAERYETSRKLSMGEDYHAPEHTSTSAAREIEQVAHQLGISEQWRTEWKRQRLEAE